MKKENIIVTKTEAFSVRIINLHKYLENVKKEFAMSNQIYRCGTSIGANVAESINAQSTKDFISKLNIALKETDETEYWLRCLYHSGYITEKQYKSVFNDCHEILKILMSIVKTMKEKERAAGGAIEN